MIVWWIGKVRYVLYTQRKVGESAAVSRVFRLSRPNSINYCLSSPARRLGVLQRIRSKKVCVDRYVQLQQQQQRNERLAFAVGKERSGDGMSVCETPALMFSSWELGAKSLTAMLQKNLGIDNVHTQR